MERINPFKFYDLAQRLHRLDALGPHTSLDDAFLPIYGLRTAIDAVVAGDPIELGVAKHQALALQSAINGIVARHFTQTSAEGEAIWKYPIPGDDPILPWEWDAAKKALENFETVFGDEMREAAVYRVPVRGIFDTAKLVDAADQTFPADVLGALPAKAKQDWCAAGRCLAFNLLSASGFHVTRAVESVMEAYYQLFAGKTGTLKSWNDYLKALEGLDEKAPHGKPSPKTLAELRQMKDDYRNPIAHPRVVLSEGDARMLYANGESVIIAMAQEIQKVKAKSGGLGALQVVASAG